MSSIFTQDRALLETPPSVDPFDQFAAWFDEARRSEPNDPEAMTLATVAPDGSPSVRVLLLKGADRSGFVFYTNLESRKATELLADPRAAMGFHWKSLRRQIRIEGRVVAVSDVEADAYFASRQHGSQIGAWASLQSRPLDSRATLERRVAEFAARYPAGSVPRPPFWSGFRLVPERIEFWRDMPHRLHERQLFTRAGDGWTTEWLYPVSDAGAMDFAARGRLMRRATAAAFLVGLALVAAKLAAFLLTDSMAMLSSLIDSLLDVCASLVNFLAVSHSLQPADREHRFGHGKAESLAGLGQSVFIGGSAVFLFIEAGRRLFAPQPVVNSGIGVAVVIVTLLVTIALVRFQSQVVRRTGSLAVSADALHYRGDLLLNGGVLLALVVGPWLGLDWLDPALALVIGGFVLYGAWRIVLDSLDILMDRELSDQDRARIRALCQAEPEVLGVHEMRTRSAGQNIFVQLHLELDGAMRLREANAIAHRVEHKIQAAFPGAEVMIHQDPTSEAPHAAAWDKSASEAKTG